MHVCLVGVGSHVLLKRSQRFQSMRLRLLARLGTLSPVRARKLQGSSTLNQYGRTTVAATVHVWTAFRSLI